MEPHDRVLGGSGSAAEPSLAGRVDGVPERFVPEEMHGQLVEAEHLLRYGWACRLVAGRRVLDAGCGVGYGTAMLRNAGAGETTGVDSAAAILDVARETAPEGLTYEVADVAQLPFPNGHFDVVVCFEVIEHVDDPDAVLDEFKRVMAPDGILVLSSPNRDRTVPGNPHHRYEYTPGELRVALSARFPEVRLIQQHAMLASVISAGNQPALLVDTPVWSLVTPEPDDELYTLAVAGASVPDLGSSAIALTSLVELREWLNHYHRQDEILRDQLRLIEELDGLRVDGSAAMALLAEREQELAQLPALREQARTTELRLQLQLDSQLEELGLQTERLRDELEEVRTQLERSQAVVRGLTGSLSWRVTAPLRFLKRLATRR